MKKPTYYLWKTDYSSQEEYEAAKETYTHLGFRVVTYTDCASNQNLLDGLKEIIKNYDIQKDGCL